MTIFRLMCLCMAPVTIANVSAQAARAGVGPAATIDSLLLAEHRRGQPIGILVLKRGVPIYSRSLGASTFRADALPMPLLAATTLTLVRDGQLTYSDLVTRHLPDAGDQWRGLTVQHLLARTARQYGYRGRDDEYVMLARIIGRIGGTSVNDAIAARVLIPAGMRKARMEVDGTIWVTLDDMAAWDRAIQRGDIVPHDGWTHGWRSGNQMVAAMSASAQAGSSYVRFMDDELTIVVLAGGDTDVQAMSNQVATIIDTKYYVQPPVSGEHHRHDR